MRIPVIGRDHSLLYYAARGRTLVERTDNVKRARRRLGRAIRQRPDKPVDQVGHQLHQSSKGGE